MRKRTSLYIATLVLVYTLLELSTSTEESNWLCTVNDIKKGQSESDLLPTDIIDNQNDFHARCNASCRMVVENNIVRQRCTDYDKNYAVYRCPNNEARYYVMSYDRCYLKHYTLCNDKALPSDSNLIDNIADLFCGCGDLQTYVGNTTCSTDLISSNQTYCKRYSKNQPWISIRNVCSGYKSCMYDEDHKFEDLCSKTNAEGVPYFGRYCTSDMDGSLGRRRFVNNAFICDGSFDCETDHSDEHDCPSDRGIYCDRNSTQSEYFVTMGNICDQYVHCDKDNNDVTKYEHGLDESEDECPINYCWSKKNDKERLFIGTTMMCNAETDCVDAKDENGTYCAEYRGMDINDGASCDDDTLWIEQKYLCTGRELCKDGTDGNVTRWNCASHEKCYMDGDEFPLLCNSTTWCGVTSGISGYLACSNNCKNGTATDVRRCSNSDNGFICLVNDKNLFIHKTRMCDGEETCKDSKDEENCENGYYCGNTLIAWRNLCLSSACSDGSDNLCDSDFLDKIVEKDEEDHSLITEYINHELIENGTSNVLNIDVYTEDDYKRFLKHRIFACQEHLYDMDGPKGSIIRDTIEEQCYTEDKFSCIRRYDTKFTASERIMKSWLCDGYADCKGENPQDEDLAVLKTCRGNSQCYSPSMKCDDVKDCEEGDDEIGCTSQGTICGDKDNTVIEDDYVCDGYPDCPTQVDELMCDDKVVGNSSQDCSVLGTKTLYSAAVVDGETVTLKPKQFNVTKNCTCERFQGGDYLTNVCNNKEVACADWKKFENVTCYNGSWYTDSYNTPSFDPDCEGSRIFESRLDESGSVTYVPLIQFTKSEPYLEKSFFCNNATSRRSCGIALEKMCDFINDCGDWSDESDKYCGNNFMCKDNGVVRSVEHISKTCDGTSHCVNAQDECLERCNDGFLLNIKRILGEDVSLLVIVWIFGIVSLVLNFYLIVTMTNSALEVLNTMPHRFIYRILITTIAIGDIMVSVYLVILASVDSFRSGNYCQVKESWLTGNLCITMGVISTFGNHVSLLAMVTLSFFRLKTVVDYLWPRTINSAKAVRISVILVAAIMFSALLISTIPLVDVLKDNFVDRYYFPKRRGMFNNGTKLSLYNTYSNYWDEGKKTGLLTRDDRLNISASSSWDDLINATHSLFIKSDMMTGMKPFSFYSSHGVCLFNYLNAPGNSSFGYVITIIMLNIVCFFAIIISYIVIWRIGTSSKSTEKKLQRKLSIAVALNIICRMPLFLVCLVHALTEDNNMNYNDPNGGTTKYYRVLSVFIIPINSVINPFINSEVQFLQLFRIKKRKHQAGNTMGVTINNTAVTKTFQNSTDSPQSHKTRNISTEI